MKILRVTPLPPEYIAGLSLYCKNLSINLAIRKNVKSDIITPDLLNRNKKIDYIHPLVKIIYKKKIFFIEKNLLYPVVNIANYINKHYRDYDIIHVHGYHFFTTTQCALLKKIHDFPFLLHIHGGIQTPYNPVSNTSENIQLIIKTKIFDNIVGKFHIKSADKLISVADKDLAIIRKKYNINNNKSCHIPDGVDIEKFKRNKKIERKYITLMATRLTYIKGVDIFINIVKELYRKNKNLKFLIIGDGPLKNLVLNAQKHLPIKFYTSFPYEKIEDIYNMTKLLMITSRTEGVPTPIYEGFACETPIISSDVGGISSVISPNVNGHLFDVTKYKSVISVILDLIKNDELLETYGKNGRKLIEENYSWKVITDKIYEIYKGML
jgi:glycosyltransferase involved in cell wall biosynthesis